MNTLLRSFLVFAVVAVWGKAANPNASRNAALRYWAAFSQLQDSTLAPAQVRNVTAILDGTADFRDHRFQELIRKNRLALEIMSRATLLPDCDWGLDYELGANLPVEYARSALILGRLNVIYAFQLMGKGDIGGAVQTLAAGVRFSHDVANGGSLFANIIAKDLLIAHLKAIDKLTRGDELDTTQRLRLAKAVSPPKLELDWSAAAKRDLEILRNQSKQESGNSTAMDSIESAYTAALNDQSAAMSAQLALSRAPKKLTEAIPKLSGVLKAKQDLSGAIRQANSVLQ